MKYLLLTVWCVLLNSVLCAQDITKDTIKLKEVLVTGVKIPEKDKSVVPVQSVSRKDLDRIAGNNVADAIKNFSGITLKDYGGIGGLKTVMVRSLGANHTGVFLDDVQFNDVATGQIDLGKISLNNVDNVSLFIGQPQKICLPAKFYASSSVISIQSTDPDFSNKKFRAKASLKTGSFGLINPALSFQNEISKTIYSDFSANYTRANGEYPFRLSGNSSNDTVSKRLNSDFESILLNATLGAKFSNNSKLSFKLYYFGSERGLPGAVIDNNPYAKQRLWNRDFFANLQFKSNPQNKLQKLTNMKFSQLWLRYLDPYYPNTQGKIDNTYTQREYYVSQAVSYKPLDSLYVSLASDFFVNMLDANGGQYARPTRYSSLSALAFTYRFKRLEINGNALLTLVRETTREGIAAPPRNKVTPTLFLGYKLTSSPAISVRLLYKDVFRMPTFNDLYYTLVGNNNLKPENARQLNLGFTAYRQKWIFDYLSVKTDIFYNRVKDKIVAIPTQNLFVWSMQNIGKVDIKGVELQTNLKTREFANISYSLACNYTYQKATDITDWQSATYNQQIPYIPFETFSALASVGFRALTLTYNPIFSGYRYVLGQNKSENMLRSWWASDVTLLYKWNVKKTALTLKGEINNIFGKQYEIISRFPMPGRAYNLTIHITY